VRGPDLLTRPAPVTIDLTAPGRLAAPRRRWLVTGAVAGLTLLVVVAARTRGVPPPPPPGAAAVLQAAATAVERSPDPVLRRGQALLVTTRQYTLDGDREPVGVDQLVQEWIPADPRDMWVQRIRDVGPGAPVPMTESRGRCGDYYPTAGRDSCGRPGLWQDPTPAFIAALPRDPRALLARLQADAAENGTDVRQEALVFAAQALERGLLPARVRAAVYRALALLPDLRVLETTRSLEGRAGIAVGVDAAGVRVEIVVDPRTGAYLGRCHVLSAYRSGLPPGTVTDATSLRLTIAGQATSL
jgi:hypothetical protein